MSGTHPEGPRSLYLNVCHTWGLWAVLKPLHETLPWPPSPPSPPPPDPASDHSLLLPEFPVPVKGPLTSVLQTRPPRGSSPLHFSPTRPSRWTAAAWLRRRRVPTSLPHDPGRPSAANIVSPLLWVRLSDELQVKVSTGALSPGGLTKVRGSAPWTAACPASLQGRP